MRRPLPRWAIPGLLVTLGGCAERGLASQPETPPGVGTWLVVTVAVVLAGTVLGALLLGARSRPRLPAIVLAVDAGIVVVGLAVLIGVGLRSWRFAEQRREEALVPGRSLLRISALDGDPRFFSLALLLIVLIGGLAVALLVLAARFADRGDRAERWAALAVLAVLLLGALLSVGLVALGSRWWPVLVGVAQLPFLVAAVVAAVPTRSHRTARPLDSGYNGRHG